jgi:hypothetical protein
MLRVVWYAKSSPSSLHRALLQCRADRQWKFDVLTGSFVDDEELFRLITA